MEQNHILPYREELLNKDCVSHFKLVGDFCCGPDDPLNTFLSDNAFEYADQRQGKTYVLMDENQSTILAFYTIKANAIHTQDVSNNEYLALPVVEIARIAVQFPFQGKGLGKVLFYDYILPKIKKVSDIIAIYGIIVFVEDNNINGIKFYETLGFEEADDSIQHAIGDSFNERCKLYVLSLENAKCQEPK